jgi:hypothetical protein
MYYTALKNFLDHLLHFGWLGSWTLSAVLGPAFQIEYNTVNKTGFVSEVLSYVCIARQQGGVLKPSNPDGVLEVICEL